MSEEFVLKLKRPLKIGSEELKELKFREPEARDWWDLPATKSMTFGHFMELAANVTGTPLKVLKTLCQEDMISVMDYLGKYSPDGPATGEEQSG